MNIIVLSWVNIIESKICGSKFSQIFPGFIFAYDVIVTILSRLIFAFAISVLLTFNVLMVRKEELFIKSPKLQETIFIITNEKAKVFKIKTTLIKA